MHAKETSLLPKLHASPYSHITIKPYLIPKPSPAPGVDCLQLLKNLDIGKGLGPRLIKHDSQELHTHVPQEVPSSGSVTQTSEKNLPAY